jgi:ATP-dependent phosphoenolpyruvate carboxykinase
MGKFILLQFLRPEAAELANFAPEDGTLRTKFMADPAIDGTRNFAILDFTKVVLIGGTGYTGEMKKEFSLL